MRNYKQISYGEAGAGKTPMDVLHSLLPEIQISGFESARTSIFEEDCQAVINFKQVKAARRFLRLRRKAAQDMQLTIRVTEAQEAPRTFDIYSEIVLVA